MHITHITLDQFVKGGEFKGYVIIHDTRGVEQIVQFSQSSGFFTTPDLTVNGYELGFNDLWVETEEEQGYVAITFDKRLALETIFLSDEDFEFLEVEVGKFCGALLTRATEASEEAFYDVIERAKKPPVKDNYANKYLRLSASGLVVPLLGAIALGEGS